MKVGYVMGGGDEVPEAIRRMGIDVTMLDADMLATGDLSQFDTIVVGIRASETRPDFVANNGRLLQYVERGGTLIVQYQQGEYIERNMAPYPGVAEGQPARHRRDRAGEDSGARASGVHVSQPA